MIKFIEDAIERRCACRFMTSMAFCLAIAATAKAQTQTPTAPEKDTSKDKSETTHRVDVGFDNFSALVLDEKTATFYNDFQPFVNASIEDGHGHKAGVSALELVIYDGKTITPVLAKFMAELDKKFNDGGELFLKVGRENTQGGFVFPNDIGYAAESKYVPPFANNSERMVLGYMKNGSFIELGTMQNTGTGKYVIIPNMDEIDFWGKGHLSLLTKSGIKVDLEAATRLGAHSQMGMVGTTVKGENFGMSALAIRDFKNNDNKCLVRAYKNLKSGAKIIGEIAHRGQGKGIDIALGADKSGMQVFTQYNTADKGTQVGVSYTLGGKKSVSHKTRERKVYDARSQL